MSQVSVIPILSLFPPKEARIYKKIPLKDAFLTNRFLLKSSADHMTVNPHLHVNCSTNKVIAKFVNILQIRQRTLSKSESLHLQISILWKLNSLHA